MKKTKTPDPALDSTLDMDPKEANALIDLALASTLEVDADVVSQVRAAVAEQQELDPTIQEDLQTVLARLKASGAVSHGGSIKESASVKGSAPGREPPMDTPAHLARQRLAAVSEPIVTTTRHGLTAKQAGLMIAFGALLGLGLGLAAFFW